MIITEFMEKGSLAKLLVSEPDLSYRKRLRIAIGVCSGMSRMHDLVCLKKKIFFKEFSKLLNFIFNLFLDNYV